MCSLLLYRRCRARRKDVKRASRTLQWWQKTKRVWHKADLCITECSVLWTQLPRKTQEVFTKLILVSVLLSVCAYFSGFAFCYKISYKGLLSHASLTKFAKFSNRGRSNKIPCTKIYWVQFFGRSKVAWAVLKYNYVFDLTKYRSSSVLQGFDKTSTESINW